MYRIPTCLLLLILVASPAGAQETDEEAAATEETEVVEPAEEDPEFDETGLDEQGYADEDDDFRPTEEIPTDQSIEFPTDI